MTVARTSGPHLPPVFVAGAPRPRGAAAEDDAALAHVRARSGSAKARPTGARGPAPPGREIGGDMQAGRGARPVKRRMRRAAWRLLAAAVAMPAPAAGLAATGVWEAPAEQSLVGRTESYVARYEDTLLDVARRFGMGISEMRLANPGVDLWLPGEGAQIRLPSRFILPAGPRSGLVVNVPEMRIYYYPKGESVVHTWPISIGRVGWETPLGRTRIVRKAVRPTWFPPDSIREEYLERGETLPRVVRPGPDNPLGSHALYLGLPAYLIHGTNRPYSIGMRVSHGCVRMYPEHVEKLFEMAEPGTPVTLVHQGVKAGWAGDELFIEVHPNVDVPDEEARPSLSEAVRSIIAATPEGGPPSTVDWKRVKEALATANGIPVAVGMRQAPRSSGGVDTSSG